MTKIPGGIRVSLKIEVRDVLGNITETFDHPDDPTLKQFAQLIRLNILANAETIKDTSAASNAESINTASATPTIVAGTDGTAPTFADYTLNAQTETVAATIGAISSNTFTVSGVITAGASRAYQEVGLRVTVNGHLYLLCRDTFSTINVASSGTLTVTYTFTFN